MTNPLIHRQLSIADWDFIERNDLDLSAIHWYPGSFAPGLPGILVELLSSPGDTIFDPFSGVGSTAVAALLRGRNSISCDISIIGLMSGLATTGLVSLQLKEPKLFHEVFGDLEVIIFGTERQSGLIANTLQGSRAVDEYIEFYGGTSLRTVSDMLFKQPSLGNLNPWYHQKTLDELLLLLSSIQSAQTSMFCKIVGYTMLSAIARAASSETRSWGHIADNVRPKEFVYKDVGQLALRWLKRIRKQIMTVRPSVIMSDWTPRFEFRLINWLVDQPKSADNSGALLITSPPYGGAIDYGLAQRLSLYLIGMTDDMISMTVNDEIGARRKRFKTDHVGSWARELVQSVGAQLDYIHSSGFVVFVMPHRDHGRDAGEVLLKEALRARGWNLWFATDRSVRQSRTRQSWTSIKKETVLVFKERM